MLPRLPDDDSFVSFWIVAGIRAGVSSRLLCDTPVKRGPAGLWIGTWIFHRRPAAVLLSLGWLVGVVPYGARPISACAAAGAIVPGFCEGPIPIMPVFCAISRDVRMFWRVTWFLAAAISCGEPVGRKGHTRLTPLGQRCPGTRRWGPPKAN